MNIRSKFIGVALTLAVGALVSTFAAPHSAIAAPPKAKKPGKATKHILVVTATTGFRHGSIPVAREVIAKLGTDNGAWDTDYADCDPDLYGHQGTDEEKKTLNDAIKSVLAEKMSPTALKKYDAIIFANTTGELPLPDPQAFLDYIKDGHGFAAMHSGSDTFHTWPSPYEGKDKGEPTPYLQMLGGEFLPHHDQGENEMIIRDPDHPAMKAIVQAGKNGTLSNVDTHKNTVAMGGTKWKTFDEIYPLKNNDPAKVHVLLDLDHYPNDKSEEAGKPGQHLISWSKAYGKGRVFYTVLGHRDEMWRDPLYQQHVLGGIKFVLGLAKGSTTPGNFVLPK